METQPETLGEVLRARRNELGLSLAEVAEKTRIGRAYLCALEEDRPETFPAETYRNGFLRTYAQILGLKMEDLPDCRGPLPAADPAVPLIAAEPHSSAGRSIFAVVASVLLVVAAIVFASFFRTAPEISAVVADVPRSVEPPRKVQEEADVLFADDQSEEEEGTVLSEELAAADAPVAPAEKLTDSAPSHPAPQAVQAAPQAVQASSPKQEAFSGHGEVAVNVIRLRALRPNRLELVLDSRPSQRYELKAESELSWRLRRSALIRVDDPSAVELWFGDERLDFGGRSQILLEARPENGGERS